MYVWHIIQKKTIVGIISREASISAVLSYAGVAIGFVNVTLLMTQWFTPDQYGLREILLNVAVFATQFAHLGTFRSLVKFYPFFKSDGKGDNGLLVIGLLFPFIGFLIVSLLALLFKSSIVGFYQEKSPLFIEYFFYSFPLLFFLLYNNVFESYLQARSKTIFSIFLRDVFNRLTTTFLLILYYFGVIDFHLFIVFFVFSYSISVLLFILYLISKGELHLKISKSIFRPKLRKIYLNFSGYSIMSDASTVLVNRIDAIMIAGFLGLAQTAIYANAVYLVAIILIPAASINKISLPIISDRWKHKKLDEIDIVYKKTSITQFATSGVLFILVWANLDNFYVIQGDVYSVGKTTFLILGIAKLINFVFGANGQIIGISKYYRYDTTTGIILGVLTIFTNYIFIPYWGIEGAAFATALSILIYNLIRFFFVYRKLQMQPFTLNTIKTSIILLLGFGLNELLPTLPNIYLDSIYRTVIEVIFLGFSIYYLKISEDINGFINKYLALVFKKTN